VIKRIIDFENHRFLELPKIGGFLVILMKETKEFPLHLV